MIDLTKETLVPLSQVPKHLPRRPSGKKIHISAIYRWQGKGIRGVRLETAVLGGSTFTSTEAIIRFSERLTAQRANPKTPISRLTRARQVQAQQAAQEVRERLGIRKPSTDPATTICVRRELASPMPATKEATHDE